MDISIGAKNGADAVPLMRQAVRELPQLRPLCLVVKAMLKEAGACPRCLPVSVTRLLVCMQLRVPPLPPALRRPERHAYRRLVLLDTPCCGLDRVHA